MSESLTPYEFGNLVAHLLAAGRVDDADRLLGLETDGSANWWYEARDSRAELDVYLEELRVVADAVIRHRPAERRVTAARYQLMSCSVRTANSSLPGDFLLMLVLDGLWSMSQTLALASGPTSDHGIAEAVVTLGPSLSAVDAERAAAIAGGVSRPLSRVMALSSVLAALPADRRGPVAAQIITDVQQFYRFEKSPPVRGTVILSGPVPLHLALAGLTPRLAPYLPADRLDHLVALCVSAGADDGFAGLVAHLPSDRLAEAATAARTMAPFASAALSALASRADGATRDDLCREALELAHGLDSDYERAAALAAMARWLPPTRQSQALSDAVNRLRSDIPGFVLDAARWVQGFDADVAGPAVDWVLDAALRLPEPADWDDFPVSRGDILVALAPALTGPVLRRAFAAAWQLDDRHERLRATAALAVRFPSPQRDVETARVADAARASQQEWQSTNVLRKLLPYLADPVATLAEVYDGRWDSAYAAVRGHVPTSVWRDLLTRCLTEKRRIRDSQWQEELLGRLARYTSPPASELETRTVVDTPEGIDDLRRARERLKRDGVKRLGVDGALRAVRRLPIPEQPPLLRAIAEEASVIDGQYGRARGRHILADLAEHLAGHHLPSTVDEILDVLLPRLAAQRRSDFLTDLGALLPCLVGHDAAATDRLATSVIEAGRWWR